MGLILPCFVSQRALIKCLLHDAFVLFVGHLRLLACKLRKCRFSSSCSLERYRAQRRGSMNTGGMDDFTLAWEDVQQQAVNYLVSGSPSGYMAQSPRACWEVKSWKPSPLLHSKIFCLSGSSWIKEASSMSECRQDAYLCLHLFVPSNILWCVCICVYICIDIGSVSDWVCGEPIF